jgi:LysM repeat protein
VARPRRPTASRRARRPEHNWTRYAAPAAFLLAATIAILLIRSGIRGSEPATSTRPAATASKPKPKPKPAKRKTTTRKTTTGAATYYTVVAGDTFGTIASKNGTTVAKIESLNPGVKSTSLFIGQRIRVG